MYKRVLLKLSGEILAGEEQFGIDYTALTYIANEIAEAHAVLIDDLFNNFYAGIK
ncbi:MAG: hypothetical protein HY769_09135 [Candidatus Stahlbacteria bacterium]|nr:hypothetical protein [Candidatus Stahlbacteria bacterium]